MEHHTTLELAIQNLKLLSKVLEVKANEDKFYNTEFGYLLENLSFELNKHSVDLREIDYLFGAA
jgi:hypothetical protein